MRTLLKIFPKDLANLKISPCVFSNFHLSFGCHKAFVCSAVCLSNYATGGGCSAAALVV